jgi:hypothetical protein
VTTCVSLPPVVCACSYPLTFCPPGAGSFSGSLELVLSSTGEKLAYSLAGKASESLAEGHMLVECQVSHCVCVGGALASRRAVS